MLQFDKKYQDYLNKCNAYGLAMQTMAFEQVTFAPKNGFDFTNQMISILAKEEFEFRTDPDMIEWIKNYKETLDKDSLEYMEVNKHLEALQKISNIPSDVYANFILTRQNSSNQWQKSKETNDYESFKPHLKAIMEATLKNTTYHPRYNGHNAYDLLLDDYEPGTNQAFYDEFFAKIKQGLVPLIKKIHETKQIDDSILHTDYPIEKQETFMNMLFDYLKIDFDSVYVTTSEHPFTDFFSAHDVRFTTHYFKNLPISAILSTIHEYGHALYGLQMNQDFDKTQLCEVGTAAHESQSRLLENHIGHHTALWKALYPKFQNLFDQLKDISFEQFIKMINKSECSLIRTEADELTYPLHILIRYEIEKEIANQTVDYDDLPSLWNQKYKDYLQVEPKTDSEGILQDMHWGSGYLGYFPTYALGSAMACQLYLQMEKDLDLDSILSSDRFDQVARWLHDNVHKHAATKSMMQIIEDVCHEPFSVDHYINYLIDKYTKLYNL